MASTKICVKMYTQAMRYISSVEEQRKAGKERERDFSLARGMLLHGKVVGEGRYPPKLRAPISTKGRVCGGHVAG